MREYEIWSRPGGALSSEYGKEFLREAMRSAQIPEEAYIGLSEIPDATDCERLQISLAAGEYVVAQFHDFSESNNLNPDRNVPESAARFLEYMEGRCLAWVHIFDGYPSDVLSTIVKKAEELGNFVVDPYSAAL